LRINLLLQHEALGVGQGLPASCYFSLGSDHFNRGQRSHIDLRLIVFQQFSPSESLSLHLHILVHAHKIVIEADHSGSSGNQLLPEYEVSDLLIIDRDSDVAPVGRKAESLHQEVASTVEPKGGKPCKDCSPRAPS